MAEKIGWGSLPNIPRLMVEFAEGRPEIIRLLGGDWRSAEQRRLTAAKRVERGRPAGLGSAIRTGYGDLQLTAAVEKNLAALDEPDTLAVVTGQQVGIFSGPLYTYYKALTAVLLAEALEAEAPGRVVPLFWMETSDADFGEINRADFPPLNGSPRRVVYTPREAVERKSISVHRLTSRIDTVRSEVEEWLGGSPYGDKIAGWLREAYQPGKPIAVAFRELMHRLFGKRGLVILDPQAPEIASRAADFWELCLDEPRRLNSAFHIASGEITSAGLPLQVRLREDALPILHLDEQGVRRRLYSLEETGSDSPEELSRKRKRCTIGKEGSEVSVAELKELSQSRPGALTASVLLRPLLQDHLLPTWIYVGGSAEVAYHAQIGRAYDFLNLPRPLIAPRISLTLIERPLRRLMERHNWTVMDVMGGREVMLRLHGHSQSLTELFDNGEEQLNSWLARIERTADEMAVNVATEVDRAGRKLLYQWNKLRNVTQNKIAERDRVRVEHAERLMNALTPDGMLQERHNNILYYLASYGENLVNTIVGEVALFESQHLVIDLEEQA